MTTMTRIAATTPLLLLIVNWITVCVCLQGYHAYELTRGRGRIPERSHWVGSRDTRTLTRLSLESDGSNGGNDNDKDEATMKQQQQSNYIERTEDQKATRADSSTPESPPPAPVPVPTTTSTAKSARTSTENKMTTQQLMAGIGTSPRRIFVSLASSTAIALGANFLGITSKLLEAVPEATVEASGLDIFFPVGDYKRCRGKGYTFSYPTEWVADTTVELAKAQRQAGALDYSSKSKSNSMLPDAAFGPPGNLNARGVSAGDTNVSVLRSPVPAGFTLQALGTPVKVAEDFLMLSLAPKGSGRTATLVNAVDDLVDRQVYQFEYTVDRGERGPPLRAISVVCVQGGGGGVGNTNNRDIMTPPTAAPATRTLLTLTVIAPQKEWTGVYETKLRKIASSFHPTAR